MVTEHSDRDGTRHGGNGVDPAAAPPASDDNPTPRSRGDDGVEWHIDGDIVDEWGRGSFPASDPPANW